MKKGIHPEYFPAAKATCSCGNSFTVGATVPEFKLEVCSACHPLYTGKSKLMDSAGRVDRFKSRQAKAQPKVAKVEEVKE